ncbi:MAG TPA: hypothetical protein VD768_08770 [Sphingomicrobium sp.]|nr:hypothetical protein [Sphingomicrobium sp.]
MAEGKSHAFAFGDEAWPGLAKLTEECGEVLQVIGKMMMTHGDRAHWSGDLRAMLLDEVADLEAAIVFCCRHNLSPDERRAMARRVTAKVAKFEDWHANFDADPPPTLLQSEARHER